MDDHIYKVIHFYLKSAIGTFRSSAFHARKAYEGYAVLHSSKESLRLRDEAVQHLHKAYAVANVLQGEDLEHVFDFIEDCVRFVAIGDANFLKPWEIVA